MNNTVASWTVAVGSTVGVGVTVSVGSVVVSEMLQPTSKEPISNPKKVCFMFEA
jgi:tetrahydrodipicolinate N-succinyltransferase